MNIILAKSLSAISLIAASGAAYAANAGILSAMPDSSQSLADAIGQTADASDSGQAPAPAIPNEVTESASSNPFQAFIEVFTGGDDNESSAGKEVNWNSVAPTRTPVTPTPSESASNSDREEPSDETPTANPSHSNSDSPAAAEPTRPSTSTSNTHSGGSTAGSGSSSSSSSSDTTSGASGGYEDDDDDDGDDDHDDDHDDDDEDEDDD